MKWWMALFVPVFAIFISYIPIYTAPFIWDDHLFIGQWELIRDVRNLPQFFLGVLPADHMGDYRPLHGVLQTILYQFYALNPVPYHILAVVVHVGTTLAVFFVLQKLVRLFHQSYSLLGILFASLCFGLHPLAIEPIAFVTASFDTVGILFAILSYYLFLHFLTTKRARWMVISGVCSTIAFLFYELTYTLPMLMGVTALLHFTKEKISLRNIVKSFLHSLPAGIILLVILFFRFLMLRLPFDPTYIDPGPWLRFLAMMHALYQYCLQTVFPGHLAAIHEIAPGITTLQVSSGAFQQLNLVNLKVISTLILVMTLCFCAWRLRKQYPLGSLGIIWFFVGLLPVMNILAPGPIYSERYLYMSLIGFVILLYSLVSKFAHKQTVVIVVFLLPFLYGGRTFFRLIDWANPVLFWTKEASYHPNVGLIYKSLGNEYQFREQLAEALAAYQKGIELMPEDAGMYYNSSVILFDLQKRNEAIIYAKKAVMLEPSVAAYIHHLEYLEKLPL